MKFRVALSALAAAETRARTAPVLPSGQARRPAATRQPLTTAVLLALGGAFAPGPGHAQTAPDPALFMQEQLRRMGSGASSLHQASQPALPAAPRPAAPDLVAKVHIREIQFSRSELLGAGELRALADGFVGRSLATSDLQQLLDAIASLYESKGILSAAGVLPQQDLQSGVLRVLLVEGRLGEVLVGPLEAGAPVNPDWVQTWFALPSGEVIANEQLRRRLALFNLASDFQAQARFVPGARFGVSDLAVDVTEPVRLQTWAMADTHPGHTGARHSLALGLRWAPASARGGRADAAVLGNAEGRTVTGAFSMPMGVQGWRAGLNASASRSSVRVASTTASPDLILHGASESLGTELEHTRVLAAPWVLTSSVSAGSLKSTTSLDGLTLVANQLDKLALSVRISHETATSKGHVRTSVVSARSGGLRHGYVETSAHWRQALDARGLWQWRATGQLRSGVDGLPGSNDAWAAGGVDSLRGFDANTLIGWRGHALQLELRRQLHGEGRRRLEGFAFVDGARAQAADIAPSARSMGAGMQTQLSESVGVDLTFSRQLQGLRGQRSRLNVRLVAAW